MRGVEIGSKIIGDGHPTYVIAEAGVNHLGSVDRALDLITKAKESGADAIKFQTYEAEKLTLPDAPRFWDWEGEEDPNGSQFDSYSHLDKMDREGYEIMKRKCDEIGIEFLSTPFDKESVDMLDEIGVRAFKIASCDITNHPFLSHVAKKDKPILLSTGASNYQEIKEAVEIIHLAGNIELIILHCILSYPTKYEDVNLRMISFLRDKFSCYPIGFSDHTIGIFVPPLAVSFGACVVEKHYTLDKNLSLSADHWLSVDPGELKEMIENIRFAEKVRGEYNKGIVKSEVRAHEYARRKIVVCVPIKMGEEFTEENLTAKRPGYDGIPPNEMYRFLGKKAGRNLEKDESIGYDDILRC